MTRCLRLLQLHVLLFHNYWTETGRWNPVLPRHAREIWKEGKPSQVVPGGLAERPPERRMPITARDHPANVAGTMSASDHKPVKANLETASSIA